MQNLVFKSNINCNNCLAKVQPLLNNEKGIDSWDVDLKSDDRILKVQTNSLNPEDIKKIVLKAGFIVEFIEARDE
jgi:copper chaperone